MTPYQLYSRRLKQRMLDIYGTFCACCGETRFEFLTINHIDGQGAAHRRELGLHDKFGRSKSGCKFYARILKLDKDPNLEVLCFNCNCAKHYYGECPHKVLTVAV